MIFFHILVLVNFACAAINYGTSSKERSMVKESLKINKRSINNKLPRNLRKLNKRSIFINYWTNWTSPIKYYVDNRLNVRRIMSVLKHISDHTCLEFEKVNNIIFTDQPLVYILEDYCASTTGKTRRYQITTIDLTYACSDRFGAVAHETLHALGLSHEQQRTDRDKYVKIHEENVPEEYKTDISDIDNSTYFTFYNISYDYGSIMHYPTTSSVVGFKPLITSRGNPLYNKMMGQSEGLSFNDFQLLNTYYCLSRCSHSILKCKNGGYIDWRTCSRCICPSEYSGVDCNYVKPLFDSCSKTNLIAKNFYTLLNETGIKKCNYRIRSVNKKCIYISIYEVNTKEKEICSPRFGLEVKYLTDKGVTGLCLCGKYKSVNFISENDEVYIEYHGLESSNYFSLIYAECSDHKKESIVIEHNEDNF
uniref:Metalloendopeptidase n=1 Tax=Parastrongyloides trichosuri TaxID=131310 RepID=A0A0N4ZI41_PARTI